MQDGGSHWTLYVFSSWRQNKNILSAYFSASFSAKSGSDSFCNIANNNNVRNRRQRFTFELIQNIRERALEQTNWETCRQTTVRRLLLTHLWCIVLIKVRYPVHYILSVPPLHILAVHFIGKEQQHDKQKEGNYVNHIPNRFLQIDDGISSCGGHIRTPSGGVQGNGDGRLCDQGGFSPLRDPSQGGNVLHEPPDRMDPGPAHMRTYHLLHQWVRKVKVYTKPEEEKGENATRVIIKTQNIHTCWNNRNRDPPVREWGSAGLAEYNSFDFKYLNSFE